MATPTLVCFQDPKAKDPLSCAQSKTIILNKANTDVNLILSDAAPAGGMPVIVNTITPHLFAPADKNGWPTTVTIPAGKTYGVLSLSILATGSGQIFACPNGTTVCGVTGVTAYVRSFAKATESHIDHFRHPGIIILGPGAGMPIFFQANLPSSLLNPNGDQSYLLPVGSGPIPIQSTIDQLPSSSGSTSPSSGPSSPGSGSGAASAPPSNRLLISADNPSVLNPPPDDAGRPGTFPYIVNFTSSYDVITSFTPGPGAVSGSSVTLKLYPFPNVLVLGIPPLSVNNQVVTIVIRFE